MAERAIHFFKLSGAGNDFVALVEPREQPRPQLIRDVCRRGHSLGADGVFVLRRIVDTEATDAQRASEGSGTSVAVPSIEMQHYNADGSHAELCANGTRCAARLAFHLGWARSELILVTASGALYARELGDGTIRVQTPPPPRPPEIFQLDHPELAQAARAWFVTVGVPHLVVLLAAPTTSWPSLGDFPIERFAPALRRHSTLPSGANVNFVMAQRGSSGSERNGPARFDLRTWERGVEGETLACGSGAVATATVLHRTQGVALPIELAVRGGDVLRIGGAAELHAGTDADESPAGSGGDPAPGLWQEGPARLIAQGTLLLEA